MSKYLWIDTETTGLTPVKHGVHQVSGIIEYGHLSAENKIEGTFEVKTNPFSIEVTELSEWTDKVTGELTNALKVSGSSKDQVMGYNDYRESYTKLIDLFDQHIDKFPSHDNALPTN